MLNDIIRKWKKIVTSNYILALEFYKNNITYGSTMVII